MLCLSEVNYIIIRPSSCMAENIRYGILKRKSKQSLSNKFLVRLHGEYNILVKLYGNTT